MNKEQQSAKSLLRSSICSVLDSMPPEERREKSIRIFQQVVHTEHYRYAGKHNGLMIYLNFGSEVQTVPQFCEMPVIVPFCGNNEIIPVRIFSFNELESGIFGIPEPKLSIRSQAERLVKPEEINCVLVPGLAFDKQCRRLGRGKGYYDRFLKRLPPQCVSIGLAFECQVAESIPADDRDIPVSFIATENCCYWQKN